MPSWVPPNQTQPRLPSRRGMICAAWFWTQGGGDVGLDAGRVVGAGAEDGGAGGCPGGGPAGWEAAMSFHTRAASSSVKGSMGGAHEGPGGVAGLLRQERP